MAGRFVGLSDLEWKLFERAIFFGGDEEPQFGKIGLTRLCRKNIFWAENFLEKKRLIKQLQRLGE